MMLEYNYIINRISATCLLLPASLIILGISDLFSLKYYLLTQLYLFAQSVGKNNINYQNDVTLYCIIGKYYKIKKVEQFGSYNNKSLCIISDKAIIYTNRIYLTTIA